MPLDGDMADRADDTEGVNIINNCCDRHLLDIDEWISSILQYLCALIVYYHLFFRYGAHDFDRSTVELLV